jgi:hypothetical protein
VFNGWRESKLTADEWSKWFDAIDALPSLDLTSTHGIAEVLYSKASRKESSIPVELMDRGYTLTKRVWARLEKEDASETPGDNDWVTLAINRAAGKVAQFWLEYLSVLRGRDGDQWKGIPSSVQTDLISVVTGKSTSAGLAEVIIASHFHYFFYLDAKFARTHLLSLFDWSVDEVRATRSWQGFLAWGRWQKSYLDEMLPLYAQTVSHLNQLPPKFRESFAGHVAGIAVFGKTDALADGWLRSFIREFDREMRRHFAEALSAILGNMEADAATDLWNRWLRRFWDERVLGRPVPLDPDELNQMARWPLHLGKVVGEAVNLLMKSATLHLQYPFADEELEKLRTLSETLPDPVADYLLIILRGLNQLYDTKAVLQLMADLEAAGVDSIKLTGIRDELLRLR